MVEFWNGYAWPTIWIVIQILVVLVPLLIAVAYLTYAERKVIAAMQLRQGPMVVGPMGLLQPLADGLKMFVKETVIPTGATIVVCIAGMDAIGRPLDETHVHRPERVARITGTPIGATVTPETVATVLWHPEGGRKSIPPGARWIALLNKADTPSRRAAADAVARLLAQRAAEVIVGQLKRTPPVLTVLW